MSQNLDLLLEQLENFGEKNDDGNTDRSKKMLNITRDTGEFLQVLVVARKALNILEIGTSNGYSTLWLAQAASLTGGKVTTVEYSEFKLALAQKNFELSGLAPLINQVNDAALNVLQNMPNQSVDFLFLDSERNEYESFWPEMERVLAPSGMLVVDNATSHVREVKPLVRMINQNPKFITSLVPVGKGEFLAVKK